MNVSSSATEEEIGRYCWPTSAGRPSRSRTATATPPSTESTVAGKPWSLRPGRSPSNSSSRCSSVCGSSSPRPKRRPPGPASRPRRRRNRSSRSGLVATPAPLDGDRQVRARPSRPEQRRSLAAGHERAAADRGRGQRHPREAHRPGQLQPPPAAAAAARALDVVVVEHGLARRGDLDEPERAVVAGDEALERGPAVVGVAVGELEGARARQLERGDRAAVAVGATTPRRPSAPTAAPPRTRRARLRRPGRPPHPPASS